MEVVPTTGVPARLTWYHDGTAVDPRLDGRLQLSSNGSTFSLVTREPSQHADAGVYTARISSLELTRDGPPTACGRMAANLLRNYAVVAATEFIVSKGKEGKLITCPLNALYILVGVHFHEITVLLEELHDVTRVLYCLVT